MNKIQSSIEPRLDRGRPVVRHFVPSPDNRHAGACRVAKFTPDERQKMRRSEGRDSGARRRRARNADRRLDDPEPPPHPWRMEFLASLTLPGLVFCIVVGTIILTRLDGRSRRKAKAEGEAAKLDADLMDASRRD
ncbi:MAG: hypothetical protein ACXU8S_09215 [Phenylobacterium sp.]